MRGTFKLVFFLAFMIWVAGCAEEETSKVTLTDITFPARERKIILYSNDGKEIHTWKGYYAIFARNSTRVLKIGKKEIIISEGILVAEDK